MNQRPRLASAALSALVLILVASPSLAGRSFTAQLDGQQEVPVNNSLASGTCLAVLSTDETELHINCTHNLQGAIAAHIHAAFPGVSGGIVFPFGDPASPLSATWDLGPGDVADLLVGKLYVNVHSPDFPAGEIRGQLRLLPALEEEVYSFPLSPDQVTDPRDSDASGRCLVVLDGTETAIDVTCIHDVENTTVAHIHQAPAGTNGGIVFPFDDPTSPIRATFDVDPDEVATLRDAGYYVNVHSETYPSGEIRGQIAGCAANETTLCLNGGRFQVMVDWDSGEAAGTATAVPRTDGSGEFWFFNPSNIELLIKVVNGCDFNDHYWVFFAGTTTLGLTVTVVDLQTSTMRVFENELGTPADAVTDIEAFATCP